MKDFDIYAYNGGSFLETYTKTFTDADVSITNYQDNKCVLDTIYSVGHRDYNVENSVYPNPSFLYLLNLEYSNVALTTDGYVQRTDSSFDKILREDIGKVTESLDKAKKT